MATYYASKAYVVSLTSAIYEELRARNSRVHVCAVCPGPVDTEFNDVANCKFGVSSITPQFCAKRLWRECSAESSSLSLRGL